MSLILLRQAACLPPPLEGGERALGISLSTTQKAPHQLNMGPYALSLILSAKNPLIFLNLYVYLKKPFVRYSIITFIFVRQISPNTQDRFACCILSTAASASLSGSCPDNNADI